MNYGQNTTCFNVNDNTPTKTIGSVDGGINCYLTYGYMASDKTAMVIRSVGKVDQPDKCDSVQLPTDTVYFYKLFLANN